MSNRQRLTFAAIAAVIAVVAVVVLAGGSGGDPERAARAPTPTATATPTATTPEEATSPEPVETPTAEPSITPVTEVQEIEVKGGKVVGGEAEIEVEEGNEVQFEVSSDVADEVHVHGYDVKKDVKAGGRASFEFKATIPGVFEVEMEGLGLPVARLRVTE